MEPTGELETVVTDTKRIIERLATRENRLSEALQSIDTVAEDLKSLAAVMLNRVNTLTTAGQQLNTKIQGLSTQLDVVRDDSTEMKTRLITIEANIESVRQTVVALLDQAGEPEPPTTTTPPPVEEG